MHGPTSFRVGCYDPGVSIVHGDHRAMFLLRSIYATREDREDEC
jgi:hypothetical protein